MSARREYEAPDLEAALARQIRAMVKRAAEGDLETLSCLARVEAAVHAAQADAARALHDDFRQPYSWTEIARELGISRQAAQMRFGHRDAS